MYLIYIPERNRYNLHVSLVCISLSSASSPLKKKNNNKKNKKKKKVKKKFKIKMWNWNMKFWNTFVFVLLYLGIFLYLCAKGLVGGSFNSLPKASELFCRRNKNSTPIKMQTKENPRLSRKTSGQYVQFLWCCGVLFPNRVQVCYQGFGKSAFILLSYICMFSRDQIDHDIISVCLAEMPVL